MEIFESFKGKKMEIFFKHGSKDVTSGVVRGTEDNCLVLDRGHDKITYIPIDNIARFEEIVEPTEE